MVGGFAVWFHGFKRGYKDFDIWVDDSITNIENLNQAFNDYGGIGFKPNDFQKNSTGWFEVTLSTGNPLKFFSSLKGIECCFDECFKLAPVAEIEGIMVPFLHINHLLANKRAVFRPKDQIDIIELEKIKEERRQMGLD